MNLIKTSIKALNKRIDALVGGSLLTKVIDERIDLEVGGSLEEQVAFRRGQDYGTFIGEVETKASFLETLWAERTNISIKGLSNIINKERDYFRQLRKYINYGINYAKDKNNLLPYSFLIFAKKYKKTAQSYFEIYRRLQNYIKSQEENTKIK